jgi:membrane-associated phospholipid phosphatase
MSRTGAPATREVAKGSPPFGLFGLRATLVLGACLAGAGVCVLADAAREHDGASRLDPVTAAAVLDIRTATATYLARVFTFLGSEVVVGGLATVVLVSLLMRRQLSQATVFAIAMGGSAILTVTLKLLVARPRPGGLDRLGPLDQTYSFPSGHTLNSTVFLALVVWLLWASVTHTGRVVLVTAGAVVAAGVAASRVYLGYHWLTDVLASGLVAIAWLCIVWLLASTFAKPRRT